MTEKENLKIYVLKVTQEEITKTATKELAYEAAAKRLNSEGRVNFQGKPFTKAGVKALYNPRTKPGATLPVTDPEAGNAERVIEEEEVTHEKPPLPKSDPKDTQQQNEPGIVLPEHSPTPTFEFSNELPDNYQPGELRAMIETYRSQSTVTPVPATFDEVRPTFQGKRRNTGVHVHEDILRRAIEKVKTEKRKTGGSLSLLVEVLLWRYIGEPEDVLEGHALVAPPAPAQAPDHGAAIDGGADVTDPTTVE